MRLAQETVVLATQHGPRLAAGRHLGEEAQEERLMVGIPRTRERIDGQRRFGREADGLAAQQLGEAAVGVPLVEDEDGRAAPPLLQDQVGHQERLAGPRLPRDEHVGGRVAVPGVEGHRLPPAREEELRR